MKYKAKIKMDRFIRNEFLRNTYGYFNLVAIIFGIILGIIGESIIIPVIMGKISISNQALLFLSVNIAGAFGGLLYALRDKKMIELPCFETNTKSNTVINIGSIADCAYGISGAFVVFLIIPGTFNLITPWDNIKVIATAIIGGYGGRAIVDKVLSEILKKRIEEVESKLEDKDKQTLKDTAALSLVSSQLDVGEYEIPISEEELKETIKAASPTIKIQIFQKAERVRIDNWKEKNPIMEKTIPIFKALIESDTEEKFHRNHAQLGYIFKDKISPDWINAEAELSKAIKIRDQKGQKKEFLMYEFNRAICRIQLDEAFKKNQKSLPKIRDAILMDLRDAAQIERLADLIKEVKPIPLWLKLNDISPQTLS